MNWAATFDGILALIALALTLQAPRSLPALRLGSWLLACAALLGALRFSDLWPQPSLHQFFSMLGAGVGLPLLAVTLAMPDSAVSLQRRFSWIYGVALSVVCILVTLVAQIKLWPSVCALLSAVVILAAGVRRKDGQVAVAGLLMLLALLAFAGKVQTESLRPGEFLHIGLSLCLLTLWRWSNRFAQSEALPTD